MGGCVGTVRVVGTVGVPGRRPGGMVVVPAAAVGLMPGGTDVVPMAAIRFGITIGRIIGGRAATSETIPNAARNPRLITPRFFKSDFMTIPPLGRNMAITRVVPELNLRKSRAQQI
jgi:hypothetical protein